MKVKMHVATSWSGKRLKAGEVVEVQDNIGTRWVTANIAETVEIEPSGDKPLERMTTAELTAKAEEVGVDISVATTNKQRIELIQAFIDGAHGGDPDGKE